MGSNKLVPPHFPVPRMLQWKTFEQGYRFMYSSAHTISSINWKLQQLDIGMLES